MGETTIAERLLQEHDNTGYVDSYEYARMDVVVVEAAAALERLEREVERLRKENLSQINELTEYGQDVEQLKDADQSLRTQLAQVERERDEARRGADNLHGRLQHSAADTREREFERDEARRDLHEERSRANDYRDSIVRLNQDADVLREQLAEARGALRQCLSVFAHPNFTDRHGMADICRAALPEPEPRRDASARAEPSQAEREGS